MACAQLYTLLHLLSSIYMSEEAEYFRQNSQTKPFNISGKWYTTLVR